MTIRITEENLEGLCSEINRQTSSPLEPYSLGLDARYHPNAGCYHLSGAYGGRELVRMCKTGTGVTDVFGCGHVPKRDLYNRMRAFILGLEEAS
jgi:hypothetical protein